MEERVKVISVNPAQSTLGVRNGIVDEFVPREHVVNDSYAFETPDFLHTFLFPVSNISSSQSLFSLGLRICISAILFVAGICILVDLPELLDSAPLLHGIAQKASSALAVEASPAWGAAELVASLLILGGLFTRPVAILTTILLTLITMHITGWEQIISAFSALLTCLLAVLGPGRLSADMLLHLLLKKK